MYGNNLASVNRTELLDDIVVVTFLVIKPVDKEYNWFVKFFGIAKMIMCGNFGTVLPVYHYYGGVGNAKGRNCSADKVVRTRAVDEIQLFPVPFRVERCCKYGIAVFLFYWKIVADGIFCGNASASLNLTTFIKQSFGESGLSRPVAAEKRDVLNLFCLIDFHVN